MKDEVNGASEQWKRSRSGAWAGRGFHYQHLISTLLLIRQWAGHAPSGYLVPEGLDDCVIELADSDIWLQIKSRKDGAFKDSEVQTILANTTAKAAVLHGVKDNHVAVVLEQPRTDRSEVGIDQIFSSQKPSVLVCSNPREEGIKLLSAQLDTAEVIAGGILSDLYALISEASQKNASLPFEERRRISTTEIERRIFERLEAEDSSAIDRAMASGALEPVDFASYIGDPAFYQGVKVRPGHVAAGLVFDRPDYTDAVIRSLRWRRHVLISGPSGVGKSALMWLSAKLLAGDFRWYLITERAIAADANAIICFLRARQPNEASPIGLAFDDVSSANHDLWNVLVRELRGMPEVYLLGSIRQEDVALIANQADTEFIGVSLGEELAETVWKKLHAESQTSWEHWREPFEQSEGLMLEYVHVLTQGRRLQAVIDEQVQQRQKEHRDDELAIIRSTAVICARGGELRTSQLFKLLNMEPVDASRALSRLLDEHLVREIRPGVLGGLHVLRSQALARASHDEAAFLSVDSLWQSLPAVTGETLAITVQSILANGLEESEASALRKLGEILGANSDVDTWTGILTGLGLATLEQRVNSFIGMLSKHGVPRAQWSFASMFGDPDIKIPELSDFDHWKSVREAVLAFRALPKDDLRPACLECLPDENVVPCCQDLRQANKFLSCLAPICGGDPVPLSIAPDFVGAGEQDIREVAALLSTAYMIGPDVAERLVQAFGGEQILFEWFRSQTPWTIAPTVDPNGSHGRTVRSDWYYVAENEQPDPHNTICGICEILIAISPGSNAAAADAVNPLGQPIAIGDHRPWSKNMPRSNLSAKARVAWNVAFRQILLARSSSDTLTDYAGQMAELVKRTEKVFRSFTEKWIKGISIANAGALATEVDEIIRAISDLAYAAPEKVMSEMTAPPTGVVEEDTLGALLSGILDNLMRRMNQTPGEGTKGTATFAGSLSARAHDHQPSDLWRTSSKPPLRELDALRERLSDVACILHEMAHDGGRSSIQGIVQAAKKGRLGEAIRSAARRCRSLADRRFRKRLKDLESTLTDIGWSARCWSRSTKDSDSVYWPAREVAVLVEIQDFETDAGYIEDSLAAGQRHLGTNWRFRIAPVINGYVVPALAVIPTSHGPLPDYDFSKEWRDLIKRPFLSPEIIDRFDEAFAACTQLSGILACRDPESLHPDEHEAFSKSIESFERNRDQVAEVAEDTGAEHLALACNYLDESWDQVVHEFEAAKAGQPVTLPLCMDVHRTLAGQAGDYTTDFAGLRIFMLQAECIGAAKHAGISPTEAY
jgi:hypothetical protein